MISWRVCNLIYYYGERCFLTIFLDIEDDSVMKHSPVIWRKDMEAGVDRGRQYNHPTNESHNSCDEASGAKVETAALS